MNTLDNSKEDLYAVFVDDNEFYSTRFFWGVFTEDRLEEAKKEAIEYWQKKYSDASLNVEKIKINQRWQ